MRQPTKKDDKAYFKQYCDKLIIQIEAEMRKLTKDLDKLNNTHRLYSEKFGEKLTLDIHKE